MFAKRNRRRLVSILVIVALLWTQIVVAAHGLCASNAPAGTCNIELVAAHEGVADDAVAEADDTMDAGCSVHCSKDESSSDVSRIMPLPAMLPMAFGWADLYPLMVIDSSAHADALASTSGSHGPTGHPAAVLLI